MLLYYMLRDVKFDIKVNQMFIVKFSIVTFLTIYIYYQIRLLIFLAQFL